MKLLAVNNGFTQFIAQAVSGNWTRDRKSPTTMWRDCVEGRVVADDWQNADDAVTQRLR